MRSARFIRRRADWFGGVTGGLITGVALMVLLPGPGVILFGLFGVLPGAVSGAFGLWVAYAPKSVG